MSARPAWIPSRTITIVVSAYNQGSARMVRVTGPTGEAGMAPLDAHDWKAMVSWAIDVASGELGVALGSLDEECDVIIKARAGNGAGCP